MPKLQQYNFFDGVAYVEGSPSDGGEYVKIKDLRAALDKTMQKAESEGMCEAVAVLSDFRSEVLG